MEIWRLHEIMWVVNTSCKIRIIEVFINKQHAHCSDSLLIGKFLFTDEQIKYSCFYINWQIEQKYH